MSNGVIPKESLTAYQRWELNSFDAAAWRHGKRGSVHLPTAEELERMQQQAQDEGFAAGFKKGKAEADAIAQRMRMLLDSAQSELARVDEALATVLLELAVTIARQMVGEALNVRPELLLPLVHRAIGSLPPFTEPVYIAVHPSESAFLREQLDVQTGQGAWILREDATVSPGGCRVSGGGAEVDATIQTRWRRIAESLGAKASWLV